MILKKYFTILCVASIATLQSQVCTSHADGMEDLNTIGKCAIEKFKKSNKKEYVQVSTRNRYVRRKTNTYLTKLRSNLSTTTKKSIIHTIDNVDFLPTFSTCPASTKEEQTACFKSQIESHILSTLMYPQDALNNGTEDKVLTTFTINTNGYVKDVKVESSKSISSLENEAKRIINSLPQLKPAKHGGTVAELMHKVYVNFEIGAATAVGEKEAVVNYASEYIKDFVTFDQVSEKPIFITCADYGVDVRQECIRETIMQDILDNLTYPFDAAAEGIQGKVWVRFIVDKDGYVTNITSSGPEQGELLEAEAERIIKLLPKFLPGKNNGEYVNVEYFIPIEFHLDQ